MSVIDIVMWSLHAAFAGLWTGSVLFFTGAVLPAATVGTIDGDALLAISGRLRSLTRLGAVAFVVTGGHMAGTRYTVETLTGSGRGHLVVTMLALWLVLTVLVEIGGSRLESAATADGVEAAVDRSRPVFLVGAVVAVLLLVDAGVLASGLVR
ncbi:MAG: transporter [Halobacteriota archaeon]